MGLWGITRKTLDNAKRNAILCLRQGITPRRLALTLALGFSIGCLPVVGVPTILCATLALSLRLNLPAIQAANYVAMPFQLALIIPFIRLGRRLVSVDPARALDPGALLHLTSLNLAARMGILAFQALLAWFLIAIPVVIVLTVVLTPILRRIPAIGEAETN